MVSKSRLLFSCHALVWAAALLAYWAVGASAAVRYDTATPHTPPIDKHKYIPLHLYNGHNDEESLGAEEESFSVTATPSRMPPSEFILTLFRTALDVVRNVNRNRKISLPVVKSKSKLKSDVSKPSNGTELVSRESGRGFEDYYDEHHDYDTTTTTTKKPMKQSRYTDPWAGYYDWIINEFSFKFWSVFQLFTAALLLYACFSAIYYAKFNPIIPDYDREYDDYFLERSVGRNTRSLNTWELPSGSNWINPRTFQFILDAISKKYED